MVKRQIDWSKPDYLLSGSAEQVEAYHVLMRLGIMDKLQPYDPLLAGTFPIGIQIPGSDLDILCEVIDCPAFEKVAGKLFQHYEGYGVSRRVVNGMERINIRFESNGWPIELFGQNKPTREQNGYRHMMIEHRMLQLLGVPFRDAVLALKRSGVKTEPAFAQLLGLAGDPYEAMLEAAMLTDEQLMALRQ